MRTTLMIATLALVFMLTCGGPAFGDFAGVVVGSDAGYTATGIVSGQTDGYTNTTGAGLVLQPGYIGFESYSSHSDFDHNYAGVAMTSQASGGVSASAWSLGGGAVHADGDSSSGAGAGALINLPGLTGIGGMYSVVNVNGWANN